MAEYSFCKDIIEGEAGEDYIIDFLTKGWKGTLLEKKKDYTWDFKIDFENSGVQTFESKTEAYPDKVPPTQGRALYSISRP